MKVHADGSVSGLKVVKAPTTPANVKQEDSLLNATDMSKNEVDLFLRILENYYPDDEEELEDNEEDDE